MTDERNQAKIWQSRALYENAHKVGILQSINRLAQSELPADALRAGLREILWEAAEKEAADGLAGC